MCGRSNCSAINLPWALKMKPRRLSDAVQQPWQIRWPTAWSRPRRWPALQMVKRPDNHFDDVRTAPSPY